MAETLKHPEVIIIGQPVRLMGYMINEIGGRAERGEPCKPGERISGLIEGFDCVLKPVHVSHYDDYLGYAIWYHQGRDFSVLQCFWPDKQGRLPWEADCLKVAIEGQADLTKPKPQDG